MATADITIFVVIGAAGMLPGVMAESVALTDASLHNRTDQRSSERIANPNLAPPVAGMPRSTDQAACNGTSTGGPKYADD